MSVSTRNSGLIAASESSSLPPPRIARDIPPLRDSLFAILSRRASFARYRSSPRYVRHRSLAPQSVQSVPLLADTLTMYLADFLPTKVVARLGPGGIARTGRGIESIVKCVSRGLHILILPLRWAIRSRRTFQAWRIARRHRQHIEATYMSQPPREANLGVLLDGRVMIEGFQAEAHRARIWLRSLKPVAEACQVFVHLYPEEQASLPADRQIHGYLCKDHYPAVEIKEWRADRCFRDDVNLADVAPGYYRVEAGLIDVKTFRKFPVDGTSRTSVDLGWIRIGAGGPT